MSRPKSVSYFNGEGYPDPTTHQALENIQNEDAQAKNRADFLIKVLKYIISTSGFELLKRIEMKDSKTGRCFR